MRVLYYRDARSYNRVSEQGQWAGNAPSRADGSPSDCSCRVAGLGKGPLSLDQSDGEGEEEEGCGLTHRSSVCWLIPADGLPGWVR